jgi:hypothetical protein
MKKVKQKKVTETNLRVNDIIYKQENASELFEVEAYQDGVGVMISLTHHADYEAICSYIFINSQVFFSYFFLFYFFHNISPVS